MDLNELTGDELLRRAVRSARCHATRKGERHTRWMAVMETFLLGSGYAHQLCRQCGLDPQELVVR